VRWSACSHARRSGIALLAGLVSSACERSPGSPRSVARPAAIHYGRPHFRLYGMPLGDGDSLPLDGARAAVVAGNLAAILHSAEGRVIVVDLERLTFRLLGRSGSGPGDVPRPGTLPAKLAVSPNGFIGILDYGTRTIRVWDTTGTIQWFKRIGNESWGPLWGALGGGPAIWPHGFFVDTLGRAYVPLGSSRGDDARMSVLRLGPRPGDSVTSPAHESEGLVRYRFADGSQGMFQIPGDYARGEGHLHWGIDPDGLLFTARGGVSRVDTLRLGGGGGVFWTQADVARDPLPESEVARLLGGRTRTRPTPAELMPLRPAAIADLRITAANLWIGRPPGPVGREYEIVDRVTGTVRRVVLGVGPAALSDRWVLGWSTGPDGELWLDFLDLERTGPAPDTPAPLRLEQAPPVATRATTVLAPSRHQPSPEPGPHGPPGPASRSRFSMGCSTYAPQSPGVHVLVVVDSAATGSADLAMRLSPDSGSRRTRAVLSAGGHRTSSCEGARGLRFTLAGALPASLDLAISSQDARVSVLRAGTPSVHPVLLSGQATVTVRVTGSGDTRQEPSR
jgi:hypothetical protein